jgi:hypothetical protein
MLLSMDFKRVYIVTTVPETDLNTVLDAISAAGGGIIGSYTHCAFTNSGLGRFKPGADANPHVGDKQEINAVDEWRVETFCDRGVAKRVVAAIRDAHPYEEPVIYMLPLIEEDDL